RPDQAGGPGAAVRRVDAGPAASLPERVQGHRHQADADRRDPDRRRAPAAQAGDLGRREGRSRVRRQKGAIEKRYTSTPEGAGVGRVYAILDNLPAHRATDVLLFSLAHPRWEFVFQPKYAAYLNLIEPWWKVLRSLALKGRRFESWEEIEAAVGRATAYWNAHRHPFVWGRRRRHRPRRSPGVAAVPGVR